MREEAAAREISKTGNTKRNRGKYAASRIGDALASSLPGISAMHPQSPRAVDAGFPRGRTVRLDVLGKVEVLVSRGERLDDPECSADESGSRYLLALRSGARAGHDHDASPMSPSAECMLLGGGASVRDADLPDAGCLVVRFTQAALDAISDDANATRVNALAPMGRAMKDDQVAAIGAAMMSDLESPMPSSRLFLTSLALALLTHVAIRYGGLEPLERIRKGGLAPWQARRAQERMMAGLGSEVELSKVARECGLSTSHFSRAFRSTVGEPPHAWLVKRRLEAAKAMMASCDLALATVALSCGFADQSHFTRAFTREVGTTPGLWRRSVTRRPASSGQAVVSGHRRMDG